MAIKEVFNQKYSNAELTAGAIEVFDAQKVAEKSDYLPHNKIRVMNNSDQILHIYLDGYVPSGTPDYVLGAGKILDEPLDEGVQFNSVTVYNAGTGTISAGDFFVRIATAREV